MAASDIPDWVIYPDDQWHRITPAEAGFDAERFDRLLSTAEVAGAAWYGEIHAGNDWGTVITRGGHLVHIWGDPDYTFQTASVGKAFTRALVGLSVREGLIHEDDPVCDTWTGAGQLSHDHKVLTSGHHSSLTWRHLIGQPDDVSRHYGGFPVTNGPQWRKRADIPEWAQWTGDPFFDNYAHVEPGTQGQYASGGIWRLSQALTALWGRDLKDVLDEYLFGPIGILPERWDWLAGRVVHETRDFYPEMPGYADFVDPPYEIGGHVVRGGGGWAVICASDLARYGLLVASGGVWKGESLLAAQWVQGHGGGNSSRVVGDPETWLTLGMVTTAGLPSLREFGDALVGPLSIA